MSLAVSKDQTTRKKGVHFLLRLYGWLVDSDKRIDSYDTEHQVWWRKVVREHGSTKLSRGTRLKEYPFFNDFVLKIREESIRIVYCLSKCGCLKENAPPRECHY